MLAGAQRVLVQPNMINTMVSAVIYQHFAVVGLKHSLPGKVGTFVIMANVTNTTFFKSIQQLRR